MCCTSVILRPGKGKHARFEWLHSNWNRENRESKFENRNWKFETREGELKFQVSIFEFQNRKLWNRNETRKWKSQTRKSNFEDAATSAGSGANGSAHRCEPVVAVGRGAPGYWEEIFLEPPGDWSGDAFVALDVVGKADGRDFDGGARQKTLLCQEENLVRD